MSTKRNLLLATLVILPGALLILSLTFVIAMRTDALAVTLPSSPKAQNCGQITVVGNGTLLNAPQARQAANCFWHASQRCSSASLLFTTRGIDAGVNRTLTVSRQASGCTITDGVQHYVVPRPPLNTNTYTCSGVIKQSHDLRITACGADGDVVIPLV